MRMEYKSSKYKINYVEVNEHNTSKTCSMGGKSKKKMPVTIRQYKCNYCKNVMDRDINSARNIVIRQIII